LNSKQKPTFYILHFRVLMLHFWLPVLSNHWWIFEKKVLRISFSFSLLNSFSLFLSSVFCWQIPPCAPPDFLHNGVMLRVKGGLRERGRGGGRWRQWSPENESAFVCHNFCQPVLYLPTTVPTCHKLGLSKTFVRSDLWN
jgi:hypothetical protein